MLTFLLCISTIHGCSIMRQGVARREGSFSRLLFILCLAQFSHDKDPRIGAL